MTLSNNAVFFSVQNALRGSHKERKDWIKQGSRINALKEASDIGIPIKNRKRWEKEWIRSSGYSGVSGSGEEHGWLGWPPLLMIGFSHFVFSAPRDATAETRMEMTLSHVCLTRRLCCILFNYPLMSFSSWSRLFSAASQISSVGIACAGP